MSVLDRDTALPTQPSQLGNTEPNNWDHSNVNIASYSSARSVLVSNEELISFVADGDEVQGPSCLPLMSAAIGK